MNFVGRCSCGVEIRNPSEEVIGAAVTSGHISSEVAKHMRKDQSARAGSVAGQWAAHILENSHTGAPTLTLALDAGGHDGC